VLAYGFTAADGRGLFDGALWAPPAGEGPGAWTTAAPESPLGGRVRGHRVPGLPYAIDDALWVVELDGGLREEARLISADRGRLVARIAGWDHVCAAEFVRGCESRAAGRVAVMPPGDDRDLAGGYLGDLRRYVEESYSPASAAGTAAYIGARIAGIVAGPGGYDAGAGEERAAQAAWLADRLALTETPGG
jgi:hypothetical protein